MAGMAGQTMWGGIALVAGSYYIYQNDEWYHGGITRWRVDNAASLTVSTTTVNWNSAMYMPTVDVTDMLAGLTFNATLVDGNAGWHRTDPDNDAVRFHAFTGAISADFRHPDLALDITGPSDGAYHGVSRALPANTGNWQLSGTIFLAPGIANDSDFPFNAGALYFDVLDNAGKRIISWYVYATNPSGMNLAGTVVVNGSNLFPPPAGKSVVYTQVYVGALRSFSIAADVGAGTMTFSYDVHSNAAVPVLDAGANINNPASVRLAYNAPNTFNAGQPVMALTSLHFPFVGSPVQPMMSRLTVTLFQDGTRDGETRHAELVQAAEMLWRVGQQVLTSNQLSGTVTDRNGVAAGTWTYTPTAPN
jgi:hypothetical protein